MKKNCGSSCCPNCGDTPFIYATQVIAEPGVAVEGVHFPEEYVAVDNNFTKNALLCVKYTVFPRLFVNVAITVEPIELVPTIN